MSSDSCSSDEEDQLLRLADCNLRKRLGIPIESENEALQRAETETERRTASLQKAHRKVQRRVGDRKKQDKRLEATKNALSAQANSISVEEKEEDNTVDQQPSSSSLSNVTQAELQSLLQTFQHAPKAVQAAFVRGQKMFGQQKWKEASDKWAQILDMHEERAPLEPSQCRWMGDVHGRLGVAYLRQGLIQKALVCFQQVMEHVQERQYREELVIDVLRNMSVAYRDIGEMDRAMATGDEAKARLRALVGVPIESTPATMDQALLDAVEGNFATLEALLQDSERHQEIAGYVDPVTGVSFLMAAAGQGNDALIRRLLQMEKRVLELRDIRGHTALAWACKFGHANCVSLLLAKGAQFTTLDTTEIKTWPESSLKALQAHLNALKAQSQSTATPPPSAPQQVWVKPIRKGEVTEKTTITKKKKKKNTASCLPAGFHAAPVSEAAKSGKLIGRALARWDDSDAVPLPPTLENDVKSGSKVAEWDQFETNKRLFGVQSEFDEEKYTTPLNESGLTAQQVKDADRLASEIETFREATEDADDQDEEAKYGAVLGTGAYNSSTKEQIEETDSFTDAGVLK